MGVARCNDCGYSVTAALVNQLGTAGGDFLSALIALGIIAIGASLIGAFLNSLDDHAKREVLPEYDEENWQKYFR